MSLRKWLFANIGIKWEENYDEFKRCVGMPERGTPLYNWHRNQSGNKPYSLNARILKERAENEEETVWSERSVKLDDCVEQKRRE